MAIPLQPDVYERLAVANAKGVEKSGLPWAPFTDEDNREIEGDGVRSAEVLCCDLPRPAQFNEQIHRRLALELVDKHMSCTPLERYVIHAMGHVLDLRTFNRSSRKQQADRVHFVDRPWRVGTKFLVLHAHLPRFVTPIDDLYEWRYVDELFSQRYARLTSSGKPLRGCDVRISTRCIKTKRLRTIHFKSGQYLCLHRACDRCVDWLMYNEGPANRKRLDQLLAYEG